MIAPIIALFLFLGGVSVLLKRWDDAPLRDVMRTIGVICLISSLLCVAAMMMLS